MQDHGIPTWFVETFVDSENDDPALRYTGSCGLAGGFMILAKRRGEVIMRRPETVHEH